MPSALTNIAPSLSRFIGRERELGSVRESFESGEHLVTVIGTAGMGKTRLARRFGEATEPSAFPGGAWFCDLTEARDVDSICSVVASVLDVPSADADGPLAIVDKLAHAIAARGSTLVVLDNFEQIVDCAERTLGVWLARCPEARFLVTSRARLHVEGENVIELGPLAISPSATGDAPSEAVALLLDRVKRARRDVSFDEADRARLDTIVRELDGIPLAIELAALRVAFLGTRTLLELLEQRFGILKGPARSARGKGATLRDAIDWSWELLAPYERAALAQCSVFRGGFDLEGARAVVSLSDFPDAPPVVDVLQSLHDQSLLTSRPGDAGRFGLYVSIREYAAERLSEMNVVGDASRRHASHYAGAGRRHADATYGPDQRASRQWLAREKENLKKAALEAEDAAHAVTAAVALEPLMGTAGPLGEYLGILERAGAIAASVPPRLRIELGIVRGTIGRQAGLLDEAQRELDAARAEAEREGDTSLLGRALAGLGRIRIARGDLTAAAGLLEEGIALLERAGDRVHEALALASYGAVLAGRGEIARARECEERALALHTREGNLREAGMVTAFLGNISIDEGAYEEARVLFAHAAAIHDEVGDRFGQAFTGGNLAALLHRQGQAERSLPAYDAAISLFREIGARRYVGAFEGYRALALEDTGREAEARERIEAACAVLSEARDRRFQAMFQSHLARMLAASGNLDAAVRTLAEAEQMIGATDDPFLRLAVSLEGAAVAVLRARAGSGAAGAVAAAHERLRDAQVATDERRAAVAQSGDVAFAARALERVLGIASEPPGPGARAGLSPDVPQDALVVCPDGAWFHPPGGERVSLARRQALSGLLLALAEARRDHPDRAIAAEALIAAAWPGERMIRQAGANRLRVGIATLRRLGLRDAILTRPTGYLVDPAIPLVLTEEIRP